MASFKRAIKRIIGESTIDDIRAYKKYLSVKQNSSLHRVADSMKYELLTDENNHLFCGYFDISPDNPQNHDEILIHKLPLKAQSGKDSVMIAIYNAATNMVTDICKSSAWCWQMGSRLRWSSYKDVIIYNTFEDGKYITVYLDIRNKHILKKIPFALYDIDREDKYGISIDFSRLGRLRPGYGYVNMPDASIGLKAMKNDGLILVDIESPDKSELLVSYYDLDKQLSEFVKGEDYINHISFSPDGKKVMFFYIWKTSEAPGWKATLWVVDLITKRIKCLEKKDQVSHYAWHGNNELLITGIKREDKTGFYRVYNIETGNYHQLSNKELNRDGHPSYSRNGRIFYSDTYPDVQSLQTFFYIDGEKYSEVCQVFHDPRMYGEKRCDLHPHYFCGCEKVAIDTTFIGKRRSILVYDFGRQNDE